MRIITVIGTLVFIHPYSTLQLLLLQLDLCAVYDA